MISLAYIFSILLAVVAVSQADEKSNAQDSKVPSKRWIGGGGGYSSFSSSFSSSMFYSGSYLGMNPWIMSSSLWSSSYASNIYGYSIMPGAFSPLLFAKDSDKHSVSRRAISLDADLLYRRGSDDSVSCVNDKGVTQEFSKSDCIKAANELAAKQVSSASHGLCTLTLMTPHGRVSPKSIPASAFESTANGILKACSKRRNSARATESGDKDHKDDVAMVLSKNEHPASD